MLFNLGNRPNISELSAYLAEGKMPDFANHFEECSKRKIFWQKVGDVSQFVYF